MSKFFFVSADVTFSKNFIAPYLQGENFIKEYKDQDSFLIELPKVSTPVSIPSSSKPKSFVFPKHTIEKISEPMIALEDHMTNKVFSRKKVVVPRIIQV